MDCQGLADVAGSFVVAATNLVTLDSGWGEMFTDVAGSSVILPAVLVYLNSGDGAGLVDGWHPGPSLQGVLGEDGVVHSGAGSTRWRLKL